MCVCRSVSALTAEPFERLHISELLNKHILHLPHYVYGPVSQLLLRVHRKKAWLGSAVASFQVYVVLYDDKDILVLDLF